MAPVEVVAHRIVRREVRRTWLRERCVDVIIAVVVLVAFANIVLLLCGAYWLIQWLIS